MSWTDELWIACALKREARFLRERMEPPQRVVVTGLGVDRTLRSLEDFFDQRKPSLLLFTGTAGQLDPELGLGDFVFPEFWLMQSGTKFSVDPLLTARLRALGWDIGGSGVTVRSPVVRSKDRARLHQETGARICDLESAAAMMIADSCGVPCLAPKVVSDTADSGMLAFYRYFSRNMEILATKIKDLVDSLSRLD